MQLAFGMVAKKFVEVPPYLLLPQSRGSGLCYKPNTLLRSMGP